MGYWLKHIESVKDAKLVAQESIRFQDKKKLDSLAELIESFRLAGDFSAASYESCGLSKWVLNNTGTGIVFRNGSELGLESMAFAGVEPPRIDANNPIVAEMQKGYYLGNNDLEVYTKFIKDNQLAGTLDNADASISGDFSKIAVPLYVTPKMMNGLELTAYELAAVVLHEVGHIQWYFRTLTYGLVSNLIADAAANRIMSVESDLEKVQVVKDVGKMMGTKINNPETVVKEYKKENVYVHLVTALALPRANLTGSEAYANRSWERAADMYAARFGAAPYLVSALYKMSTNVFYPFRESAFINYGTHLSLELARLTLLVIGTTSLPGIFGSAIMLMLGLWTNDPKNTLYDPPAERFKVMRRQLVEELKVVEGVNTQAANSRRDRTLASIAQLDEMLKTVKDKDNLYQFIINNILPSGRREKAAIDYQRELETYLSNDLTVAASRLRSAAK